MQGFFRAFAWHSLLAGLICLAWYIPAGICVMRLIGLRGVRTRVSDWLTAPAFGLCTLGPFSLACIWLCGYSKFTLFAAWLAFLLIVLGWQRWQAIRESEPLFNEVSTTRTLILLVAAALAAFMPTAYVLPYSKDGGLVVAEPMADHFKVAMIDTMAREGMPPLNPFYAPSGKPIVLSYYYLWHFMASQLRVLIGVTGWEADVALTWFTTFAALTLMICLTMRLSSASSAGFVCLLLSLCAAPSIFLLRLHPGMDALLDLPIGHQLEPLLTQCMWVPQHILSASAILLALFIVSRMATGSGSPVAVGVCLGLIEATAFGSSVWVGGFSLLCVTPLLLIALYRSRPSSRAWLNMGWTAAVAVSFFALASIPLFKSILSAPGRTSLLSAITIEAYPVSRTHDTNTGIASVVPIILFWIKYLPVRLGLIAVLGWVALCSRRLARPYTSSFRLLSVAAAIGFILVSQFLCSIIRNNDLGWRAILVPIVLLTIWSAAYLSEYCAEQASAGWIRLIRSPTLLLSSAAIIIGLASLGLQLWWLHPLTRTLARDPIPLQPRFTHHEETGMALDVLRAWDATHNLKPVSPLAMHRKFARQMEIWAKVREYCRPDELVQSNPDGYGCVSIYPANLPVSLFADRRCAYTSPESASVFAYSYGVHEEQRQYQLMQELFSDSPSLDSIRFAHDTLHIKVLLVDDADDVWTSKHIEESGLYRIVYEDADRRIYQPNDFMPDDPPLSERIPALPNDLSSATR